MIEITCEHCSTINPSTRTACDACGAPLPDMPAISPSAKLSNRFPTYTPSIQKPHLETVRETGEDIEKITRKAFYVYGAFWRALAEAITIAMVGFGIGVIGGGTGMAVWGVIGSMGVGIAVGMTIKASYFTLLGAPIGIVIGAFISAIYWIIGLPPEGMVFIISICAILAAIIGGRNIQYKQRMFWEKARPFLGAAGGLAFGLSGMGIGIGLRMIILPILSH